MENREFSLSQLAEMVQGQLTGDPHMKITGLAPIEAAGEGDITFLAKEKQTNLLEDAKASAVIVPKNMKYDGPSPVIRVRDPYLAAAIIQNRFLEKPFIAKGIHPRACLGEECQLGKDVSIGPLVVLGNRVKIGERVAIEAGTVIGDDVVIGDDTHLYANVTIYKDTIIGNRVAIHAGTVIGADGYGYATNERGEHVKRPQVGNVRIDDDVEIGANSCVDRATFGTTWIKAGTKIDNLVMVAHNVVVGENCLLVSQTGIAGSTTLGRNVVMGGQSGTAGHVNIGDQVMVAARGGIHNDQPKGAVIGGAPAIAIRQWAKCSAVYAKLPELQSQVRKNSRAIAKLTGEPENEE